MVEAYLVLSLILIHCLKHTRHRSCFLIRGQKNTCMNMLRMHKCFQMADRLRLKKAFLKRLFSMSMQLICRKIVRSLKNGYIVKVFLSGTKYLCCGIAIRKHCWWPGRCWSNMHSISFWLAIQWYLTERLTGAYLIIMKASYSLRKIIFTILQAMNFTCSTWMKRRKNIRSSNIRIYKSYRLTDLSVQQLIWVVMIKGWQPRLNYATLKIFSIFLPFANSSTSLSKYLACFVNGVSISSMR